MRGRFGVLALCRSPSFCAPAKERTPDQGTADTMRRTALCLRRARTVTTVRAWLSILLPAAGIADYAHGDRRNARPDAELETGDPSMAAARQLLEARSARAFRGGTQSACSGDCSARLSGAGHPVTVTPASVAETFIQANPDLS